MALKYQNIAQKHLKGCLNDIKFKCSQLEASLKTYKSSKSSAFVCLFWHWKNSDFGKKKAKKKQQSKTAELKKMHTKVKIFHVLF